jgi:hypothetical protein
VVLPASMWAEIPMLRYRSSGVLRAMEILLNAASPLPFLRAGGLA